MKRALPHLAAVLVLFGGCSKRDFMQRASQQCADACAPHAWEYREFRDGCVCKGGGR